MHKIGWGWAAAWLCASVAWGRSEPFILGADISWLPEREAAGWTFYDGAAKRDALSILKDHKFNYIRLRIFNDPKAPGGYSPQGFCDLPHTMAMAKRVQAAGMRLFLDFHYSDTWADPGSQIKPAAWKNLDFPSLTLAVGDYTRSVLTALKDQGTPPDMVQIGNEINGGPMRPDGATSDWSKTGKLLKAGAHAVRTVLPAAKIVIHIAYGGDNAASRAYFDNVIQQGVDFDIMGESCYTVYHGPPEGWDRNFRDLAVRYPKYSFLIAEYSGEKRKANNVMFNLPGERGLGTFIWEPLEWLETCFDAQSGNRRVANSLIDLYPAMSKDYGNDGFVPGTAIRPTRNPRVTLIAPGGDAWSGPAFGLDGPRFDARGRERMGPPALLPLAYRESAR